MGLVCKVVGHKWHQTSDGKDGCICARCGERNRGGEHDWRKEPGSCKATCSWCGREEVQHEWDRCTCSWCGEVRDFDHKWQIVSGTCDFRCSICGAMNDSKKSHKWDGCTCSRCGEHRNEGHDFALAEDGKLVCTVCGISVDESRAQAAIEALKKEHSNYWHCREAKDLIWQMNDPVCLLSVAGYAPDWVIERLSLLGADDELAAIARGAGKFAFLSRREAQSNIRDAALRESISVEMTEDEQRWYDYDIKSGM